MRNYYTQGFDLTKWMPVKEIGGRVVVEGILRSDFTQVVATDMTNEMQHCKAWRVVAVSSGIKNIQNGDHVVVLKAAIDGVDPDTPKLGIVDSEDVCAVINQEDAL